MKVELKYLVLIIWLIIFIRYFTEYMPHNVYIYLLIIPVYIISHTIVNKIFANSKRPKI